MTEVCLFDSGQDCLAQRAQSHSAGCDVNSLPHGALATSTLAASCTVIYIYFFPLSSKRGPSRWTVVISEPVFLRRGLGAGLLSDYWLLLSVS